MRELCAMAAKAPSHLWQTFKTLSFKSYPVPLVAEFAAFRASMGAKPAQGAEDSTPSG